MKIAITGSNGFIGNELIKKLSKYEFVKIPHNLLYQSNDELKTILINSDIVINLAGVSIQKSWTRRNKYLIYQSRVATTRNLVKAISEINNRPKKLISVSAIGIYDTKNEHNEFSRNLSYDFLAKVVKDWESAANFAKNYGLEVYILRLGIVLGQNGGIIKKLFPFFKLGLGTTIGNGNQPMSFIHIDDLIKIFEYAIEGKLQEGTFNAVSPHYTTNKEFSKALAKRLNKPLLFKIPKGLLHIIFGEGAKVIYSGQKVIPTKLLENNFVFKYPNIETAIDDIISKSLS
jgi:uncharacterized protein (TIGR01777 family)